MTWNPHRQEEWHQEERPQSPLGLYRDPENGLVAGVCAGIATWFGVETKLVRLAAIGGLIFFFPVAFFGYWILAFALKPKPPRLFGSREDEVFWRGVAAEPDDTALQLCRKFRELEDRLARIEAHILREEFELSRKFRDIGG